jgi:hypothetical protein
MSRMLSCSGVSFVQPTEAPAGRISAPLSTEDTPAGRSSPAAPLRTGEDRPERTLLHVGPRPKPWRRGPTREDTAQVGPRLPRLSSPGEDRPASAALRARGRCRQGVWGSRMSRTPVTSGDWLAPMLGHDRRRVAAIAVPDLPSYARTAPAHRPHVRHQGRRTARPPARGRRAPPHEPQTPSGLGRPGRVRTPSVHRVSSTLSGPRVTACIRRANPDRGAWSSLTDGVVWAWASSASVSWTSENHGLLIRAPAERSR